jgi:calcium-translocating P-type ATPase
VTDRRSTRIQRLAPESALAALRSAATGLDAEEAERRLQEYGPNAVPQVSGEAWLRRFLRQFTHFFALVLWLAVALAFVAERMQPGQGMALLGWAVLGVILVNGSFSFVQEYRAEHALAALQRLLPREVEVLRAGTVQVVPSETLVPGDIVRLAAGADVPADCRLVEAFGVRVNNATVTGEALPCARNAAPHDEDSLLHARNILLAGTTIVGGEGTAVLFATGARTEFGRIAHLTQSTLRGATPLQREIARLSRWIAAIATGLGVLFFVLGSQLGLPFWWNLLFAIGIIVANVPEGLLPTVTLALAMGAQRMARRKALVRHLPSVETLGATTVICTDKTGTLTQNSLRVRRVFVDGAEREAAEVAAPQGTLAALCDIAANCHSLAGGDAIRARGWHGDPLELALLDFARDAGHAAALRARIDEIPFDSERRRMSTLHAEGEGVVLFTKGAPEAVLPLCTSLMTAGGVRTLDAGARERLVAAEEAMAQAGLRVIALARRVMAAPAALEPAHESGACLVGFVALEDPVRPEVPAAIAACHGAGIRVTMVTGDHPRTALAVARTIGLAPADRVPRVIAGDELTRLSETELQLALDDPGLVFARISADQKRRIVAALKGKGETVAVTGDGVNDAPALREAHIGIAMGLGGTDVARAAADMVLLDDNFASIVAAVEEGRTVFDNIRKFLTYILSSNVPEILPWLAFVLLRVPLPLTVIQILAVDLGTDMLPALGLGAERPEPDVMQRPPRPLARRLVDRSLVLRAYLWLGLMEGLAALGAYFLTLHAGGWQWGEALAGDDPLYRSATAACFATIVLMQVANVWLCRSDHLPPWRSGGGVNPLIVAGIVLEIAFLALVLYTPWGQAVFATAPPPTEALMLGAGCGVLMLAAEETRKAWWCRRRRATA